MFASLQISLGVRVLLPFSLAPLKVFAKGKNKRLKNLPPFSLFLIFSMVQIEI